MANQRFTKVLIWSVLPFVVVMLVFGIYTINVSPFRAFGGAVWVKNGVHYMNEAQISSRISELDTPKENLMATKIRTSTSSCDSQKTGFCQKTPGEYVDKTLLTPAVAYVPATPGTKVIIGYCTLCNDGSFSPSCAVGRGACSYHDGVNAYNVAEYRTTPGTPAVQAQPAVYDYAVKSYKDSPLYAIPATPSLNTIVGF